MGARWLRSPLDGSLRTDMGILIMGSVMIEKRSGG